MLLKLRASNRLVVVTDLNDLVNPFHESVLARPQWGEEEQDPESFPKEQLCFPSGESLPRCWWDEHYRDEEVERHRATRG